MFADPTDPRITGPPVYFLTQVRFGALAGLAAAVLMLTGCGKKEERGGPPVNTMPPFVVDVITLMPQRVEETLSATGTLVANEAIILQAERPGLVKEIRFREGEAVKAGEVMVLMDDSELQPQLERASAQVRIAETLEKRQAELLQSRGISEFEYEQTEANVKIACFRFNLQTSTNSSSSLLLPSRPRL